MLQTNDTETRTVEIDGQKKRVEVLGPALEEQLLEDTRVQTDIGVEFDEVGDNQLRIYLSSPGYWNSYEIKSLDESESWDIVNVGSNDYGATVTVEYVGD